MAIFSPLSVAMISALGWQDTLVWLAMLMLVIPLLGLALIGNSSTSKISESEYKQSIAQALNEALGHKSYLLLIAGFFVCGFQVAFITAHFPAYISDIGIEAKWAGIALLLIGLFNVQVPLAQDICRKDTPKPIFSPGYIYSDR